MHLPTVRAGDFEPSSIAFVWIKPTRKAFANGGFFLDETLFAKGMGHTTRQNAEYVALGRRGKPRRLRKDVHQLIFSRREHSRKPDEFYARVERYCTGPYLDCSRASDSSWSQPPGRRALQSFEPKYDAQDDFAKSLR